MDIMRYYNKNIILNIFCTVGFLVISVVLLYLGWQYWKSLFLVFGCIFALAIVIYGHILIISNRDTKFCIRKNITYLWTIFGYIYLSLYIFCIVPYFMSAREWYFRKAYNKLIVSLQTGVDLYKKEHENKYPHDINDIMIYMDTPKQLLAPLEYNAIKYELENKLWEDTLIITNRITSGLLKGGVIVRTKTRNGFVQVLFDDNSIKWIQEDKWHKIKESLYGYMISDRH